MTNSGLISVRSASPVRETADRLAAMIRSKGMTVFARIDHSANATAVGLALRPMELLIFGNPKAGTLLMQDKETSGIDLPVKALVWEDAEGAVWLTYNDAEWLARRHDLGAAATETVHAIRDGLAGLASTVSR
jgi:uncharacterized protein (DUF302 family)